MMEDPPLYYEPSPEANPLDSFDEDEVPSGMTHHMIYDGSFAVYVYSSRPYNEFFASMVEMVECKLDQDHTVGWDYMEELLLNYLELNEKKVHKYILQAFVDVIEVLNVE